MAFTTLDMVIGGACLVGMALGFWTGFAWQVVRILSVAAGLVLAWVFHDDVARLLGGEVPPFLARIGAAILIFVLALILSYVLSFLLRRPLDAIKPKTPDRLLGAAFGLVKVLLVVGGLAFAVLSYGEKGSSLRQLIQDSPGARTTARCVGAVLQAVPGVRPADR